MLLAGEMLKTFFLLKMCFWLGKSKKVKNVENGGNHVCVSMPCAQTWFPPIFNIFNFLEFPSQKHIFEKK